jgi:hypothetical protein
VAKKTVNREALYQLKAVRAVQFDPSLPKEEWPAGVNEYKPRNYVLGGYTGLLDQFIEPGDYIVYGKGVVRRRDFEALYELVAHQL